MTKRSACEVCLVKYTAAYKCQWLILTVPITVSMSSHDWQSLEKFVRWRRRVLLKKGIWNTVTLRIIKESSNRSSHHGAVERNPTRNHEVACLIPGLAQWVKDPVLLWAVVKVVDKARVWHCCGYGVSWQLQLRFDPSICHRCGPPPPKKDKKNPPIVVLEVLKKKISSMNKISMYFLLDFFLSRFCFVLFF